MKFLRLSPHRSLQNLIDCYWFMKNDDPEPTREKIIPDGFTELIFQYGDPYRVNISGTWEIQSSALMAGQISSYFHLENTGKTDTVAVKFKPAAITQLFGLIMSDYTDHISGLDTIPNLQLHNLQKELRPLQDEETTKVALDNWFLQKFPSVAENPLEKVLDQVFNTNGMVTVNELTETAGFGERQLQRLFKKYIGLSPKYYARIIRFNYIFSLVQAKSTSWNEIVFKSGYYDQSHFIRNFRDFTGEDPSSYYFEEKNMANFFLNR